MGFVSYLSFTYFAVLNVVTGIFCQSAIDTAQNNADLLVQGQMSLREAYIERIRLLFDRLDTNHGGFLTLRDLEENLGRPEAVAMLSSLNVDSDDAWALFKLLDIDMSNAISLDEFVTGLLKIKGHVRRTDVLEIQLQLTSVLRMLDRQWKQMNSVLSPATKSLADRRRILAE